MQNLTKVKVPRLGRNRLGVFFVRYPSFLNEGGRRKVVQQSLRTKDPGTAKLLALRFCLYLAGGGAGSSSDPKEGVSPWTANIETGEFSASGDDDHRLLMGFLADNKDLLLQLQALKAKAPSPVPHRPAKIRSKSFGREFGVLLDRCGIKDKSKVFHSFRSTAITDLYNAGANPAAVRKAVGHTSAAVSGAHGGYIRGQLLKALGEAIEKLQFPSIDFAKLRLADPTFKAFFDEEDAKAADPKLQERLRKRKAHGEARARRQAGLPLQRG